jgi:hypothetical protein
MAASTMQYPPVPIAFSEMRCLRSSIVGQDYQVRIRLPEHYANTTDSYPVLYLLDGDHAFAMATDIVQYLIYDEHIPDLIIASPAYGSKVLFADGGTNMRSRDFPPFPTHYTEMKPGGAAYLEFIAQELIPFVESNYRTLPTDRTLWGYSFGAFFGLFALFQKPWLFQRYIMVDGIDERHFGMEEEYAAHHTELPVRLFLSGCPHEFGRGMSRFFDQLRRRNYSGLHAEYAELNDIGHFAVPAEGLTKGLVSIFHEQVHAVETEHAGS